MFFDRVVSRSPSYEFGLPMMEQDGGVYPIDNGGYETPPYVPPVYVPPPLPPVDMPPVYVPLNVDSIPVETTLPPTIITPLTPLPVETPPYVPPINYTKPQLPRKRNFGGIRYLNSDALPPRQNPIPPPVVEPTAQAADDANLIFGFEPKTLLIAGGIAAAGLFFVMSQEKGK